MSGTPRPPPSDPVTGAWTEEQVLDKWMAQDSWEDSPRTACGASRGKVLAGESELQLACQPEGRAGAGRGARRRPWRPPRDWGLQLRWEPLAASGIESWNELVLSRDACGCCLETVVRLTGARERPRGGRGCTWRESLLSYHWRTLGQGSPGSLPCELGLPWGASGGWRIKRAPLPSSVLALQKNR